MEIKKYLKEKRISIYRLAKGTGIAYSTLNDLVNGMIPIEKCLAGNIRKIADYLCISMDEVYRMCEQTNEIIVSTSAGSDHISGTIVKTGKKFYLECDYQDRHYKKPLCQVNKTNEKYITFIAETGLLNLLMENY